MPLPQTFAEVGQAARLGRHLLAAQLTGEAEADDARHVCRAAAQAALLTAAVHLRFETDTRIAAADVESADALGAIHLVRAEAEQVNSHFLDIERNLAGRLGSIGVKKHAAFLAQSADGADRLKRADLIIGGHDADQDGPRRQGLRNLLDRYAAVSVHRQDRELKSLAAEAAQRIEDGLVLGGGRDEMIAVWPVERGDALEGEIVAFGGAAGEDDFARMRRRSGRRLAGELARPPRRPPDRSRG